VKRGQGSGKDDERGARDARYAFTRQHQRQHHEQLIADRDMQARCLGYE
jgi:hypothetical protein